MPYDIHHVRPVPIELSATSISNPALPPDTMNDPYGYEFSYSWSTEFSYPLVGGMDLDANDPGWSLSHTTRNHHIGGGYRVKTSISDASHSFFPTVDSRSEFRVLDITRHSIRVKIATSYEPGDPSDFHIRLTRFLNQESRCTRIPVRQRMSEVRISYEIYGMSPIDPSNPSYGYYNPTIILEGRSSSTDSWRMIDYSIGVETSGYFPRIKSLDGYSELLVWTPQNAILSIEYL